MWLTDEGSEGRNRMLLIFGIELPFEADSSEQADAGRDQSFRSV